MIVLSGTYKDGAVESIVPGQDQISPVQSFAAAFRIIVYISAQEQIDFVAIVSVYMLYCNQPKENGWLCRSVIDSREESIWSIIASSILRWRERSASRRPIPCGGRRNCYYDFWWRGTWEKEGGNPTMSHAVHHIDMLGASE